MKADQPDFKPVYILGAGASDMLGAPLVNNFLSKARELRYTPNFSNVVDEFDEVFEYQGKLFVTRQFLGIDLDNLETLFSILDMDWQIAKVRKNSKSQSPVYTFEELQKIRDSFFTVVIETLKRCVKNDDKDYIRIIQSLAGAEGATFITFNYDMAIENALTFVENYPGKPNYSYTYGYQEEKLEPFPRPYGRLVLKLHGSANWTYCTKCGLRSSTQYVTPKELNSNRASFHDQGCDEKGVLNVILPPSWHKHNYLDEITRIWSKSVREISLATHLFVIGYSFPRTDVFFDQLLTLSLRNSRNLKNVMILNPSEDVGNLIKDFFDKHFLTRKVEFIRGKFEDLSSGDPPHAPIHPNSSERDIESRLWRAKRNAFERQQ